MNPAPDQPATDNVAAQRAAMLRAMFHNQSTAPPHLPQGLPEDQHLRFKGEAPFDRAPYYAWKQKMLRLFRLYDCLEIMKEVCHDEADFYPYNDDDLTWEQDTAAPSRTDYRPYVWETSDDTRRLLLADALIDASIDKSVAVWVAGIDNPHRKWWLLKTLMAARSKSLGHRELYDWFKELCWVDFASAGGIRAYVQRFMEIRAEQMSINGPYGDPADYIVCLIDRLREERPELEFLQDMHDLPDTAGVLSAALRVIERVEAFQAGPNAQK